MGTPVVRVKEGLLRGATAETITGAPYIFFKGIPYAAPPVGKLRFAEPSPPQPWTGLRDALEHGPSCPQHDLHNVPVVGCNEDCLYLNVATTSLKGSRPVMVFIHGGAFIGGHANFEVFGPDYLMETGVVFVSMNYRVGVLGFLQLNDPVVPGNMGLKDQLAALKWVKENISQFGGDPGNITIFGASAGGASVHYQVLSPLSKGLFHKAIAQSGTALDHWTSVPDTAEALRRYMAAFGKETSDPREIVEFLRSIPAEELVRVQHDIVSPEDRRWLQYPFLPSIDDKSEKPFMPKSPKELVLEGTDVPLMLGYTSHEGILFVIGLQNTLSTMFDKNSKLRLPDGLVANDHPKRNAVGDEMMKFYFGDKPITEESVQNWIQACGDISFVFGALKVAEIQQKKMVPCYLYKLSFDAEKSFGKFIFKSSYTGTAHGDDHPYLFYMKITGDYLRYKPGSQEQIVSDRMIRMWTDFAKTGNPTPRIDDLIKVEWLPVSRTTKHYLLIDAELSAGVNPDEKVVKLSHRISEILNTE
ncbi:esterase FE4-like [Athalia rosae]|uniref:esterase FE4-like n=1 Tax=Athalia rosae TaxID=37344 RepID=UPI002033C226|nr:esterase FE4-like [Athalia rosae]